MLVCPEGRFKDFSLLGSIVLAWGGLGLPFAFAGPLKIQIWRPSKSDQKTCQKHVNLTHFAAFVAQVHFSSFCVVGLHCFWPGEESGFWIIGPRCFDLFWSIGSHVSWDSGPKNTKPNHQEIVKRLGFDKKEPPYAILELGSVISRLIFGEASWFWLSEGSDFWSIGHRCFDLFWSRGSHVSWDGGPKITKPNHQEIIKRFGFDRKEQSYVILGLGSVISKFIFGDAS